MTVDPTCVNVIREFNNYRAAEGRPGKNPREIAQGVDDHCMDAIRYALMHIYKLGARHHLSEVAAINGLTGNTTPSEPRLPSLAASSGTFFSMGDQW
jgi:hypothetical protein